LRRYLKEVRVGQKVNPTGFRIGITRPWVSRWYSKNDYAKNLHEDIRIRKFIKKRLYHAGISQIEIERSFKKIIVTIRTAKPGIVVGRKGVEIDRLKTELEKMVGSDSQLSINIKEIRRAELDAQLVAENIAMQLERRVGFRQAIKRALASSTKMGARGIKLMISGRLGGNEIARTEWKRVGRVPLHTLRADIHYGTAMAHTTYGIIGVKCWIFKEEVMTKDREAMKKVKISDDILYQ
jgi:small subunit ribosomal protein S3